MPVASHPNGYARVKIGPPGVSGSLSFLGYTRDGVRLSIQHGIEPVYADNAGPFVPVDYQNFGQMARLILPMMVFDWDVAESITKNTNTNPPLWFNMPVSGTLMAQSALGFRVVIESPLDNLPWRFFNCTWANAEKILSVRAEPLTLEILCWPYVNNNELHTAKLYDHTAA